MTINAESTDNEWINAAREQYANDDIEIDSNATFSVADDGVWVQAWVWVGFDNVTGD